MASNPYINKVVYGNQTLIDLTGDVIHDNDVRQGVRYHSYTGEQRTGTLNVPTIYDAIPSNNSPAPLEQGKNYNIKNTSGLAIESYSGLEPSDLNPQPITNGNWYYATKNGYAIENVPNPTALYPSNNSPQTISGGNLYKAYDNGYAISSYDNITPSNSNPVLLAPNDIVKISGNNGGYAIQNYGNITPSNSSPANFYNNGFLKANGSGYAITSYTDIIPDDADPQYIEGANMYRLQNNLSGYVYETIQSGGGTSIIPSNVAPVELTADETVTPTLNGYAIRYYSDITPSSTATNVSSGDIVKIGGSGVIVDALPTPTSITPSDSSPVALTADVAVKPTANGYAIESNPTSITPSSSAPSISSGTIYKASGNGYAINSYSNISPSAGGTYFASGFRKMSSNGYAYTQHFPDFADAPDVNWYNMSGGSSGTASIAVTQKPRYIIAAITSRGSTYNFRTIFVDVANNKGWQMGARGSGTAVNEDFTSSISAVFPTISATTVVYSYVWWAANQRVEIGIYY